MKKIIVFTCICLLSSSLFAGWYDNESSKSKDREQPQRGYEKSGDDNYLQQQTDEAIYGKGNSYQGSRAGDDDYLDRVTKRDKTVCLTPVQVYKQKDKSFC